MSIAPAQTASADEARLPSPRVRRTALLIAGVILGCAVAVLTMVLLVSTVSNGGTSVLIGTLDAEGLIGLAVVSSLATLAVGLCIIPVRRLWLLLLVPARIAAIAAAGVLGVAWFFTSSATVVPLIAAGCETGYVVYEEDFLLAGWGTVYRTDGAFVAVAERFVTDDGYHPFADGAYAIADAGTSLKVWFNGSSDYSAAPVTAEGDPSFTLPKLTDRTLACGLSTGARTPIPTAEPAPTFDAAEARMSLEEMVSASLGAAAGPVLTPTGTPLASDELAPVITACGETGTRTEMTFSFTTADNAASLARILQIWDAAGYSADQAMQDNIRHSNVLPVQSLSIRDSTTIDGLLHMHVTSACTTE